MRRILQRVRRDERGFTIIEVIVAASLLLVGVVGTIQMVNVAGEQTVSDQAREAATNLARELVEAGNHVPYEQLTPSGAASALQAVPNLANTGTGWQLQRRNFTYTVSATACTVDDKVDGYRSPSATGTFCAESSQTDAAAATQDRNGDDFRRLTVTLTWTQNSKTKSVTQSTIVNNPGDAAGPAVTTLTSNQWSPVTSSSVTSIVFSAETTGPPQTSTTTKVKYSIDGTYRGDATKVGNEWRFTWNNVNTLPDATYIVTAQAYDANNRSRGVRILRMVLNRNPATAPIALTGGRNVRLSSGGQSVIDLEWDSSNEPDVTGYRVYRNTTSSTSGATLVCETSLEGLSYGTAWTSFSRTKDPLSCADTAVPSSGSLWYGVTPLDADPLTGAVRQQQTFDTVEIFANTTKPAAPTGLTGTYSSATNTVNLSWTAPAGVTVDHYRIYRDGSALSNRYDRTAGTQTTWTDNQLAGAKHTYRVVAVSTPSSSTKYAESDPAGPTAQLGP
jgi:Tfp pilus assembly protein PilV